VPTVKGPVGLGTVTALERESAELTARGRRGKLVDPVPVKLINWGLSVLLSVIETLALRVPIADGVNVTEMVQDIPAFTVGPQVFVCE